MFTDKPKINRKKKLYYTRNHIVKSGKYDRMPTHIQIPDIISQL